MEKIGKVVNTHGIKGEVRLFLTSFDMFEQFKKGMEIFIDKKSYTIASFRKHKKFTLVTFVGFTNINDVEFLKGKNIFIETQNQDVFLSQELDGFKVYKTNGDYLGEVQEVIYNKAHPVIDLGDIMIPVVEAFTKGIDVENKELVTSYMDGREINED